MTPLERVFEQELPRLLANAPPSSSSSLIAFAAGEGPERGYWVVSLGEREVRRGREGETPAVVVEADARVLALLFSGALDVPAALREGALLVSGDTEPLLELASLLAT